ncbi:probable Regulator of G-Protein Signaling Protein [Serendipita indica DSM 11827]|uniref:Probable Regulator of G-Protein Signaling Protein n=1 Tax=Serendipita indica (strain DSM 11827) TaxID=1109443 RepID=G4T9Z9_SERID|nr:probable Regulator of G-Protein Signaling Protein [Serendipita indica DSM 11827]
MPTTHPQATSSHMMKTTKRGRPFLKDTLDLFATLITSMELTTHKQYFRSFPNSFTTDDACECLSCLKFSQSNRSADPRDPDRIITTTTTTTFSMTRDMAKAMSQHFMDARLIENAIDKTSNQFKDRSVYQLTPKGLHVLERFISKNGVNAEGLVKVFQSQPICMKLLHLERRASDDEIIISQQVVTALFRRFAGRSPNYIDEASQSDDPAVEYNQRSAGIPLSDVVERAPQLIGKGPLQTFKYCFLAVNALEWLCDFTSIVGRDEAAEMAAHFVRFGLITLLSDKRKTSDSAVIFTVRGTATGPNSAAATQGEFRCTAKAIYRITEEGRKVARWTEARPTQSSTGRDSPVGTPSSRQGSDRVSSDTNDGAPRATELAFGPGSGSHVPNTLEHTTDHQIHRRISMDEKLKTDHGTGDKGPTQKESNTDRLKFILDEPALRSLFREFLRGNFCEENLSFWLEVQEFKRKFLITSTAVSQRNVAGQGGRNIPQHAAMEKHHESLIQMAFVIYNMYLAPSSQCELNIDHGLRNDLVAYLNEVMTESTGKAVQGRVDLEQAASINATQLKHIIQLYERIQLHVFRLMATDSVPKFIKTKRFLALRHWVEDYEASENDSFLPPGYGNPSAPPGLEGENSGEIGGAYMTVSQQANEKAAAAAKEKLQRATRGDI